jgi:DNA repair photolyase
MEPRTASIQKRLDLVSKLTKEGIPVTILAAPIIPGLNDDDILPLSKKVAESGAKRLVHHVVRLNGDLQEIFSDWLEKAFKDRKEKVLNKIKSLHNGFLSNNNFGERMEGSGKIADIINQQFKMGKKLYRLDKPKFEYNLSLYGIRNGQQLSLF